MYSFVYLILLLDEYYSNLSNIMVINNMDMKLKRIGHMICMDLPLELKIPNPHIALLNSINYASCK